MQAKTSDDFTTWLDEQEQAAHRAIEHTHGEARALLYDDGQPAVPAQKVPESTGHAKAGVQQAAKPAEAAPAAEPAKAAVPTEGRHRGSDEDATETSVTEASATEASAAESSASEPAAEAAAE